MKNNVIIISVYFGSCPEYIDLYLKSCSYNPEFSFLIVTDLKIEANDISNVSIVNMNLKEFRNKVASELGYSVSIPRGYKVCDFRPTFGTVFREYINEYDFWGHSDIDLIYGRLSNFLDDITFDNNDIISMRPWYLTGFLCFYRNSKMINNLYAKSRDHRRVFESAKNFCFDECNYRWGELRDGKSILNCSTEIESMTEVIYKEKQKGKINILFLDIARESVDDKNIIWSKGKITEDNNEWALLHFITLKTLSLFHFPKWKNVPDVFTISKLGIWRGSRFKISSVFDLRPIKKIGELFTRTINVLINYK